MTSEVSYGLTVFDIDDTIFKTANKVYVIKNNKIIKALSSVEYAVYKLDPGEKFNFIEFRDASLFNQQAKPILVVLKKIKTITQRIKKKKYSKIILLTARKNMDNKKLFLNTFKNFGIDIDNIYIERAGNIDLPTHRAKKLIVSKYLNRGLFNIVRLFDDQSKNLDAFLELKEIYPKIGFEAYLVLNNNIIKYKNFNK